MLDSIAETLESDAEQATKRMVTLLEPILIIFMALIVGCIMIGGMLPIYQSTQRSKMRNYEGGTYR